MTEYRYLKMGEVVRRGDEYGACNDGWRDPVDWQPVTKERGGLGRKAPDPAYPSHTTYRRKLNLWQKFLRWVLFREMDRIASVHSDPPTNEGEQ